MPTPPAMTGWEVVKVFESLGWRFMRQTGSHLITAKEGSVAILTIPNHKEVSRGTLRGIIRTAGMTVAEFIAAI